MSENYKSILERMRKNLPAGSVSVEGTFTGNNLAVVANELARMYSQEIEPLLPRAFTDTAEGEDLDKIGNEIGLIRKSAAYAEATVLISGNPGSYQDILVGADGILFRTDPFMIKEAPVSVRAVCQRAGVIGNVPAGFIKEIKTSGVALTSVNNPEPADGGYEEEKDEDYRIRIQDKKKHQVTGGNRENYRQWAMEISGVRKAKVIDLYDGPGSVGVFIIGDGISVPQSLVKETEEYIETVRPCGARVLVRPAEFIPVHVTASVVLEKQVSIDHVKTDFQEKFQKYLESIAFLYGQKTIVSYLMVLDLLFQTEGVADVVNVRLNDGEKSIVLEETEFPLAGNVVITE